MVLAVGFFQALQRDALVRRVHVDDDQTIDRLRQDVDAVQLGQREAHARGVGQRGSGWGMAIQGSAAR